MQNFIVDSKMKMIKNTSNSVVRSMTEMQDILLDLNLAGH